MQGFAWLNHTRTFPIILLIYLLFGLVNLQYIPIAWLDEVALLDPAIQFHKTGAYASTAWGTPGAENIFLSYPPLIVWVHILNLSIYPATIFWVRLPFLIMHASAIFLLYKLLIKYINVAPIMALSICSFFLFDKAVFEISRAIRVETIEMFLWSLIFTLFYKKSPAGIIGLIMGLLFVSHLKEWPILGIFGLYYLWQYTPKKQWILFLVSAAIPVTIFLFAIHFNFQELYHQLYLNSKEHSASGNFLNKIYDFYFSRFFPVYKEQPWMPLVHIIITFIAIKELISSKGKNLFAATFLGASLVWIFILSPNYRYWVPLYFFSLPMLAEYLKKIQFNFTKYLKWYSIPVVLMLIFPFVSRHLLAFAQRTVRNPTKAIEFLNKNISNKNKTLVFGDEIGLYMTANKPNMDCGHTLEPDHFKFNNYKNVYLLTHQIYPQLKWINTYHPNALYLPKWLYSLGKGGTYNGLIIYKIQSEKEWKSVTTNYYK